MITLTYDSTKDRLGMNAQSGYLLLWSDGILGHYESICSWHVFTKSQAIDIIRMVCILAVALPMPYKVNNWTIYPEPWSTVFPCK